MIVRNGVEPEVVSVSDFEMNSTSSEKIILPYIGKVWGDLLSEAEQLILAATSLQIEDCDAHTLNHTDFLNRIEVAFYFNIQRSGIRITAYIDAFGGDDTHVSGRTFVMSKLEEVYPIMDRFFSSGCSGLSDEYANYYKQVYQACLKNNHVI